MTISCAVSELVQRHAHQNAAAKGHVCGKAPRRERRLERKAAGDQHSNYDEVRKEDHGANYTPESTSRQTIENAYKTALSGRRQAAVSAMRLHTLIAGNPQALVALRDAAMAWLICWQSEGENHIGAKSLSQHIVKRLNAAIDGTGRAVTDVLLSDEQVARLRVFRAEVRALMTEKTTHG